MNVLKTIRDGLRGIARELATTRHGHITLLVCAVFQVTIWWLTDGGPWELLLALAVAPVIMVLTAALAQFFGGFLFALVHWRRPTHSYVVLVLADGRQRRGLVCAAPCCLRAKIKKALKHEGVTWSTEGADDEQFPPEEIESWFVIPVDNPDPHASQEAAN